mmetsp:Transcript_3459/g.6489  ORF Transcript_3459/g.6489 Transcript_3459/m.6489 type:complete len:157 (+) Transcript_3459:136-606(+)
MGLWLRHVLAGRSRSPGSAIDFRKTVGRVMRTEGSREAMVRILEEMVELEEIIPWDVYERLVQIMVKRENLDVCVEILTRCKPRTSEMGSQRERYSKAWAATVGTTFKLRFAFPRHSAHVYLTLAPLGLAGKRTRTGDTRVGSFPKSSGEVRLFLL